MADRYLSVTYIRREKFTVPIKHITVRKDNGKITKHESTKNDQHKMG